MSVPNNQMQAWLAQQMQQAPDPGQAQRVNALRGQQALGILGTMGGKNLAPMGRNMYTGATGEIKDIRDRGDKSLGRTLKTLQAQKLAKDLDAPLKQQKRFTIVGDGQGGAVMLDTFSGETTPVAGAGMGPGEPIKPWNPGDPFEIPSTMKESEGKAYFQAATAATAFNDLVKLFASGYSPGIVSDTMYRTGGGGWGGRAAALASDSDDQQYVSFGMKVAESILRAQTGAAAPEQEVRAYAMMHLPQWYEEKEVQQKKINDLKLTIKHLAARAGPSGGKQLARIFDYYLEGNQGDGTTAGGSNTITDDELE